MVVPLTEILLERIITGLLRADSLDEAQLSWHRVVTENEPLADLTLWQLVIVLEVVRVVLLLVAHLHHWVAHHSRLLLVVLVG